LANKPISDEELASLVRTRISTSISAGTSNLERERLRAIRFYAGVEPRRLHDGSSGFVSRDVYDAVEARKAALLETFTGDVKPLRFSPQGPQDIQEAQIATDYVDYVVFRENNGYQIIHDAIHDGLLARTGIVQAWWEHEVQHIEETIPDLDPASAQVYLDAHQQDLVDADMTVDEQGLITLDITRQMDLSGVRIESVPPEEFGVSDRAVNLSDSDIVWRKQIKSIAELQQQGIPSDRLDLVKNWTGDDLSLDPERIQRFQPIEAGIPPDDFGDQWRNKCEVYDAYVKVATEDGRTETWHVVYAAGNVLKRERVVRHPFYAYTPLRIPHRFYGDDFAGTVIPVQVSNTVLTRAVLDSALITTNPRYQVVRGGVPNIRELVESRLGGVINVSTPESIVPLPVPQVSPLVMGVMERMDAAKQLVTGTTDLSQGISKDVISSQNSADLVSQMASMGMTRAKIMARNFSEFLSDLFLGVYQLVIENEDRQKVIEVAGSWVNVDPSEWRSRRHVTTTFAIGYGEAEKEAALFQQWDEYAASQPGLQQIYGTQQRYNTLTRAMQRRGVFDVSNYIQNPATLPPPQPSPQEVMEANLQNREMAVKEQLANVAAMKAQTAAQNDAQVTAGKMQTADVSALLKAQQHQLQVEKFEHQRVIDSAEVALQHRATEIQAVAMPSRDE